MAGKLRLDMDFIDVSKYDDVLLNFKRHLFITANDVWAEGIIAFTKVAGDTVLIDTAMSAISLTAPLEEIDGALSSSMKNELLARRKRARAQPLRNLDGGLVRGAFRNADSAMREAKRNTKVLELSFSNSILEFRYKVSVWQIDFVMKQAPIDAGFDAFERVIKTGFGAGFKKKLKIKTFLNPFKKKTMFRAKAR